MRSPTRPSMPPAPELAAALAAHGPPLACVADDGQLLWWSASFAARVDPAGCDAQTLQRVLPADALARLHAGQAVVHTCAGDTEPGGWQLQLTPSHAQPRWLTLAPRSEAQALQATAQRLAERLSLVQTFARTGYFERDARSGEGWWDAHMYRIWGLPPAAPGAASPPYASVAAAMHPDDRQPGAFARSMAEPGPHSARVRVRIDRGAGESDWRHLHTQWKVEFDARQQPLRVVGVHTDDTEVYALALQAQQIGEDLEAVLAFGQIGLWRHDLGDGLVYPDRRACEMLGLPFTGQGVEQHVARERAHPDDLPGLLASYHATLRSGEPSEATIRYPRADGGWRHILTRRMLRKDASGRAAGFLGVMTDVSPLVEQARLATEAADRITLAQTALGLGIWQGQVGADGAWWDEQMFRLRGVRSLPRVVRRAEAVGYLHPDDRHLLQSAHRTLDDAGTPDGWQLEYRVVWPDGTVRWLASRSQVLPPDGPSRPQHFGVNWDVTDAHVAREALRESERARAESEAKSQFLSRISHELRTPMNAMLGFTELMRQSPDAEPALRDRWLAHVHEAGQHLLALIDDVLDLARADVGQLRLLLRPTDLAELVDSTLPLVAAAARSRDVTIEWSGHADGPVQCDPVRLRQVLLNLLSNAIKYNRPGGTVRMTARREGHDVVLAVADEGQGLSEEQQAELFRPFNRLGAELGSVEGTGIGLSIAKTLAERMGGRITVRSQPGQGCVFELGLPAADESAASDAPPPMPALPSAPESAATGAAPARVLYIEDNPVNALLVIELLRRHADFELRVAETGAAGLALAAEWQPAVVLIDLQLPDIDGLEVHTRLRAMPAMAGAACVALSADAMAEHVAAARAAGFDDYWTKPILFDRFLRDLRGLVSARQP